MTNTEAEIIGITCTAGNVPARQVATNNLAWLELVGYPEVEVALGSEIPIVQPLMTTEETHGPQGIGHAELPAPTRTLSDRHATDVWIDAARRRPGEVVGLVTGPLTNLALAIRKNPEVIPLVKRVYYMGGAIDVPGNTTPSAEFNWWFDPEAVRITLRAPFREQVIVPIDIAERVFYTKAEYDRVAAAPETPITKLF